MTDKQLSSSPTSRRKILIAAGLALVTATAIGVLFVLPAEFGIDPTGVGAATGLLKISDPGMTSEQKRGALRKGVLAVGPGEPETGAQDHWTYELAPYESIELKYEIAEGQAIRFRWSTSRPVHYDMHAHPFSGGTAATESYGVGDAAVLEGRYVAAFTGIHGWYWQNRSIEPLTLTLDASGAIRGSKVFGPGGEQDRPLSPPPEAAR